MAHTTTFMFFSEKIYPQKSNAAQAECVRVIKVNVIRKMLNGVIGVRFLGTMSAFIECVYL